MQNIVKEFNNNLQKLNPEIRMLDIVSEVGELTKEIIKSNQYGKTSFQITNDLMLEMGDVLYAILSFCEENKIDSEQCLNMAIEKYRNRLIKKGRLDSN